MELLYHHPLLFWTLVVTGPGGLITCAIIVFCQEFKKAWQEEQKKHPTSTVRLLPLKVKTHDVPFDPLD